MRTIEFNDCQFGKLPALCSAGFETLAFVAWFFFNVPLFLIQSFSLSSAGSNSNCSSRSFVLRGFSVPLSLRSSSVLILAIYSDRSVTFVSTSLVIKLSMLTVQLAMA